MVNTNDTIGAIRIGTSGTVTLDKVEVIDGGVEVMADASTAPTVTIKNSTVNNSIKDGLGFYATDSIAVTAQ